MISEGPCDTEDWSNDAENTALPPHELIYLKKQTNRKVIENVNHISQN